MRGSNRIWAFLVMILLLGSAIGARAATMYALTCEPARGGTFTIPLIGFTFKVTGGAAEGPTGMAGRRTPSFDLTVRFAPSSDYQTMLSLAQANEVLRTCRLVDGEGSGVAAKDNWTQMAVPKGMNNSKTGNPAQAKGMTWTFTNATVTTVTAIGNETPAGVTEGQMQATLSAERFEFAM